MADNGTWNVPRDALPLHALEVLTYGAMYGHADIYQKAAPIVVLQNRLNEVLQRLPASLLMPWVTNTYFVSLLEIRI